MKIWIVDDYLPARLSLISILNALPGTEVREFESGTEMLEVYDGETQKPDCIFCDLLMPKIDGFVVIRELVKRGYLGRLNLVSGLGEDLLAAGIRLAKLRGLTSVSATDKPLSSAKVRCLISDRLSADGGVQYESKSIHHNDLRLALLNREFQVHYQPKVACCDGRWVGVEALLRWQHPALGNISPVDFIPMAEENGLITSLTDQLIERALEDIAELRAQGIDLQLSVNISMDSLADLTMADRWTQVVKKSKVPCSKVCFEITESRLAYRIEDALEILGRLRLQGFELSIDDFGTGFSSLSQLLNLPFHELKIDRSFVTGVTGERSKQVIFSASSDMASRLGLRTVAEGVETLDDLNFVRLNGAACAQGYFIARAMPAENLPRWATDWSKRRVSYWS